MPIGTGETPVLMAPYQSFPPPSLTPHSSSRIKTKLHSRKRIQKETFSACRVSRFGSNKTRAPSSFLCQPSECRAFSCWGGNCHGDGSIHWVLVCVCSTLFPQTHIPQSSGCFHWSQNLGFYHGAMHAQHRHTTPNNTGAAGVVGQV